MMMIKSIQRRSTEVEKDVPVNVDVGNMACFDPAPIDATVYDDAEKMKQLARDNCQLIVNAIWALPRKTLDGEGDNYEIVVDLPWPTHVLPRAKPLPKERKKTRWEKFAESKGIKKKTKRSRMKYDEERKEYMPVYGMGSSKNVDEKNTWVIEAKAGMNMDEDPFDAMKQKRKEKIQKQKDREERNVREAQEQTAIKKKGRLTSVQPTKKISGEQLKKDVEHAISSTQRSTASLGKFDKVLPGEPQKKKNVSQKFQATAKASIADEKKNSLSVLKRVFGDTGIDAGKVSKSNGKKAKRTPASGSTINFDRKKRDNDDDDD